MYTGHCIRCKKQHRDRNAICPQCRAVDPGYEYQGLLNDLGKFLHRTAVAVISAYLILKIYQLFW